MCSWRGWKGIEFVASGLRMSVHQHRAPPCVHFQICQPGCAGAALGHRIYLQLPDPVDTRGTRHQSACAVYAIQAEQPALSKLPGVFVGCRDPYYY